MPGAAYIVEKIIKFSFVFGILDLEWAYSLNDNFFDCLSVPQCYNATLLKNMEE